MRISNRTGRRRRTRVLFTMEICNLLPIILIATASFMTCFDGPLVEAQIIPLWSTSLLDGVTNDSMPLQYAGHGPLLLSTCDRNAQLYLYKYVYLSKNQFKTPVAPMRIPTSLLDDDHAVVVNAVVRSESLVLLIDGAVFVYDIHLARFTKATGVEGFRVTGLDFSQYCCTYGWCEEWSDIVIAEVVSNEPNPIYKIYGLSHTDTEFYDIETTDEMQRRNIIAAIPLRPWHIIAVLVGTDAEEEGGAGHHSAVFQYVSIASHDEDDLDYHDAAVLKALPFTITGEDLTMVHLTNRFGEFLLWGPEQLFLSQTAGQTVIRIGKELSHMRSGEVIRELVPGVNGDFAILTTKGALWYGRGSLETHVAQLSVGKMANPFSAMSFDPHGNIYVINAQRYDRAPQNDFTRTLVYLASELIYPSEVLSTHGFQLPPCPFLLFTVKFRPQLFYLDIGDTLTLPATFIPTPWQDTPLMIYPSNPSIITVNTSLVTGEPIGRGTNAIEVSTIVSLTADSPDPKVKQHIEGISTVTFATAVSSLTCQQNPSLQAFISAGCPPDKTIKYRKQVPREQCDYLKNYVYTFKSDEYDPTFMEGTNGTSEEQGDLSIQYDYGTHGCPDMSYYSDGFRPQFDLFIGDEFIEKMEADYALIEVHGVHNYEYSLNAKQAGCTRKPQSWVEMISRQGGQVDTDTAWNRHTYESCIEEGEDRIEEKHPYQVMNANTVNKILWPQIKAIYIFNITVLDPQYSFCNLHTQVAVEVYGALPTSDVSEIKVMLITCSVGLAGVIFIFIYYIIRLREAENEEQQTQKIPQFPH